MVTRMVCREVENSVPRRADSWSRDGCRGRRAPRVHDGCDGFLRRRQIVVGRLTTFPLDEQYAECEQ